MTDDLLIRRTPGGWRVGGDEISDLTSAMVLADLLAAELPPAPGDESRPSRPAADASEADRLRVTIAQLEHALEARVIVEQAIGVLAERQRIRPRKAFDRIRNAARARGRKVQDLARDIVASVTNPLLPMPPELARDPARGTGAFPAIPEAPAPGR